MFRGGAARRHKRQVPSGRCSIVGVLGRAPCRPALFARRSGFRFISNVGRFGLMRRSLREGDALAKATVAIQFISRVFQVLARGSPFGVCLRAKGVYVPPRVAKSPAVGPGAGFSAVLELFGPFLDVFMIIHCVLEARLHFFELLRIVPLRKEPPRIDRRFVTRCGLWRSPSRFARRVRCLSVALGPQPVPAESVSMVLSYVSVEVYQFPGSRTS